jgi:hypothetical protein
MIKENSERSEPDLQTPNAEFRMGSAAPSDFDIGQPARESFRSWTLTASAARTVGRFLFSAFTIRAAPSQPLNFSTSQQLS